jgi:hypothetical protein
MCVRFEGLPALVPGSVRFQRAPLLLLYKVVAGGTGGEHVSSRGMAYPLGRPVLDPAAEFGAHERCIHLVPTETDARSGSMASYGSHVLAMLAPVGRVWTTPGGPDAGRAACWHTDRYLVRNLRGGHRPAHGRHSAGAAAAGPAGADGGELG